MALKMVQFKGFRPATIWRGAAFNFLPVFSKNKFLWKLLLWVSKKFHQRVFSDWIWRISKFPFWRQILDIYRQPLLICCLPNSVKPCKLKWNSVIVVSRLSLSCRTLKNSSRQFISQSRTVSTTCRTLKYYSRFHFLKWNGICTVCEWIFYFLKRQFEEASLCILLLQSSSNFVRLIIAKAEIL